MSKKKTHEEIVAELAQKRPDKEWSAYYNKHFIPLTMMKKKELHKIHAKDCKQAKELAKLHQRLFSKAFLELKEFISHYGPF